MDCFSPGNSGADEDSARPVRDPVHPDSKILIHLLAMRGIDRKRIIEHRPPESGSAETQNMIPFDKLSLETRRRVVAELEAIECTERFKSTPI